MRILSRYKNFNLAKSMCEGWEVCDPDFFFGRAVRGFFSRRTERMRTTGRPDLDLRFFLRRSRAHPKKNYTATSKSLSASFNDTFLSVLSFRLPMIKAQPTWYSPAGNCLVYVPGITTDLGGTCPL